jgi:PAS domain S-box-containing protein
VRVPRTRLIMEGRQRSTHPERTLWLAFGLFGALVAAATTATIFLPTARPSFRALGVIAIVIAFGAGTYALRRFIIAPLFLMQNGDDMNVAIEISTERDLGLDVLTMDELAGLSTVINAAPNATIVADTSGRLALANAQADRLFYNSRGEMLGTRIEALIPEDLDWEHEMREQFVMTARRSDGSEFPAEIGLRHIATQSGTFTVVSLVDVTERRNAEELREAVSTIALHNEQLRTLNSELEAFSYSVSHDLRSPVRAIIGYAQAIEEDYGPVLNAGGLRLLSVVQDEATRMGDLIDDLLSFSRLGRKPLQSTTVKMRRLAEDVLAEQLALTNTTLPEASVSNLPATMGDPILLRQVWTNLISNAIKYSSRSEKPNISIWGEVEGDTTHYHVRDNGVGFDMRYADKLFGVFQRLHRNEEFPGTGVGLAIVQRIINRHGGSVSADATLGAGATFSFTLPIGSG